MCVWIAQAKALWHGAAASLNIGQYVIVDRLGAGGMGVVYQARHKLMNRLVAIKVLSAELSHNEVMKRRFFREVQAAGRLNHPNIVTAHDAGEHNGRLFLVMEYVDGHDVSTLLERRGAIGLEQAVNITMQAAAALDYAHTQGVIHRDVKPGNLLLRRDGTVKVLDMGLAVLIDAEHQAEHSLTVTGRMMGTVEYMPPEQAEDPRQADHRADIYALGYTLFRMLTGRLPYSGQSAFALALAHRERPIPNLAEQLPGTPPALVQVFERMVAKSPDERFASMRHVIESLQQAAPSAGDAPMLIDARQISNRPRSNPEAETTPGRDMITPPPPTLESTMPTMPVPSASALGEPQSLPPQPRTRRSQKKKPWALVMGVMIIAVIGVLAALATMAMMDDSTADAASEQTVAVVSAAPIEPAVEPEPEPAAEPAPQPEPVIEKPATPDVPMVKLAPVSTPIVNPTSLAPAAAEPDPTPTPVSDPDIEALSAAEPKSGPETIKPQQGWVDVFTFIDAGADAMEGRFEYVHGGIIAQGAPLPAPATARLQLPFQTLGSYEVEVAFAQVRGEKTGLVIPVGRQSVGITLDSQANTITLADIQGEPLSVTIEESARPRRNNILMSARVAHAGDQVRLTVMLEGQAVADWSGARSELEAPNSLRIKRRGAAAFISPQTDTHLDRVRLRMITGYARLLRTEPVDQTSSGGATTPPQPPNFPSPPDRTNPPQRPDGPGGKFDRPQRPGRPGLRPEDRQRPR